MSAKYPTPWDDHALLDKVDKQLTRALEPLENARVERIGASAAVVRAFLLSLNDEEVEVLCDWLELVHFTCTETIRKS